MFFFIVTVSVCNATKKKVFSYFTLNASFKSAADNSKICIILRNTIHLKCQGIFSQIRKKKKTTKKNKKKQNIHFIMLSDDLTGGLRVK